MKKKSAIIIAIILMSIGFAAISTTLIINGISNISENKEDFDIYFSSAMIDKEDYTNEIISKDKKTITFETKNLKSINEETTLDYEVTNGSTQYDASGKINVNVEENEYVEVTNAFDESNLSARETRSGKLTIKLKKGSIEEKNIKVSVNLEFNAVERESINKSEIVENTYSISGYFVDKEGNVLPNVNLAVFSEIPRFVTTDDHGYFYVGGLERGSHEIYYINESEVNKSKEEIEKNKIDKVNITTSSEKKIIFDKGYEIKNSRVEETHVEKVTKTLISNNGETSEIELEVNTLYKGLPTPKKSGYKFLYWKDEEGRKITEKTYVVNTSENKLYAEYTEEEYTANISISNGTSSSSSVKIIYGKTNTVKVTPNSGYYISGGSCTNGYTISGLTTGTSATGSQTITINNNSNASDTTCTISTTSVCPYTAGQVVATYNYTGGVQSFTAACSGTYKLEVWGAQGSSSTNASAGGYGGYSQGTKVLTKGATIYAVVGGRSGSYGAGYNGGGKGQYVAGGVSPSGGGGGGATHIATTNRGVLSNYNSYRGEVLIVAGGGGGAGENSGRPGGSGGGATGGSGTGGCYVPTGGSQTSAGKRGDSDASEAGFGYGGSAPNGSSTSGTYGAGGGGGGWYGGGAASFSSGSSCASSGAGGSGYIGGVIGGTMSNGARSGHGYARITFVSLG